MKITVNVDCTPQEARAFFGMPDVAPLNDMIISEMTTRAKENMDALADPEKMMAAWMNFGGKGLEGFQAMMAAAMGADNSAGKK